MDGGILARMLVSNLARSLALKVGLVTACTVI